MVDDYKMDRCSTESTRPYKICYHSRWITVATIFFASIATLAIWTVILHFAIGPNFLSYLGLKNEYFLSHPKEVMTPSALQNIGAMVTQGSLLSLDDLWNFQTGFYQTIINLLVALNAILGAFAFFMVRQSSNARAREEAILEVNRYIESKSFDDEIKKISHDRIEQIFKERFEGIKEDLEGTLQQFENLPEIVSRNEIDIINTEISEIKRHIITIAAKISLNEKDSSEESKNLVLEGGKI